MIFARSGCHFTNNITVFEYFINCHVDIRMNDIIDKITISRISLFPFHRICRFQGQTHQIIFFNPLKQYVILFIGLNYDEIKIIFANEILFFFSLIKESKPARSHSRRKSRLNWFLDGWKYWKNLYKNKGFTISQKLKKGFLEARKQSRSFLLLNYWIVIFIFINSILQKIW